MKEKIQIRRLIKEDKEKYLKLKDINKDLFEKRLKQTKDYLDETFVAILDENIVGEVTLRKDSGRYFLINEEIPEIQDLYVKEEFRNKGIGTKLIKFCTNEACIYSDKLLIGVNISNINAINLYIKNDFNFFSKIVSLEKEKIIEENENIVYNEDLAFFLIKDLTI